MARSTGTNFKRQLTLAVAISTLVACGAENPTPPPQMQTQASPFQATAEMLACAEALAPVVANTGTFGRNIRANIPEAQTYFNQGLRLTYGYYFPEAIASFDAALCFEPDNAMIHWGKALAIGPNPNSRYGSAPDDPVGDGKQAINHARELMDRLPSQDRGLIEAVTELYNTETYPDQAARTQAFIDAAEANYRTHNSDLDAAFLVAHGIMMSTPWTYYSNVDGSPLPGVERAREVLESGMAQDPQHPGLTHLHIHLLEASFEPESAVASADRLESLTPMAGHMVHMPGHIYMRVGRYNDAITTNERSLSADNVVTQAWGDRELPRNGTYFVSATNHGGHARMFIHWAGILQGNSERAMSVSEPMLMMANAEALGRGNGLRTPVAHWMTLRAFGMFDELAALENPAPGQPYLDGMLNWMHGAAFAKNGNIEAAQAEYDRLQTIRQNPELANWRASVNSTADMLTIASHMLAGEIANARSDYDAAIREFEQAVDLQDKLRYMEPPDWLQSTRLFLGQALINAGRYAEARAVFERDLIMLNENGWALQGLAAALEGLGEGAAASDVRERQAAAWSGANVQLMGAHF
jgi:tetratricopeptide (TPR) repeat protein